MKVTKLIGGLLMLMSLNSCKVHREVEKTSSRVDSTAASSKEVAQGSAFLQQGKNNRVNSLHTSGQNKYQRQTVSYQFALDTNSTNKANSTDLFIPALENRLTGITVTTEEGAQATQTGSITRQNTDVLSMAKDSVKSAEKKSTDVSKAEDGKKKITTQKTGGSLWLIILLIVVIIVLVLWIWKGNLIVSLIRGVKTAIKGSTPNTPSTPA